MTPAVARIRAEHVPWPDGHPGCSYCGGETYPCHTRIVLDALDEASDALPAVTCPACGAEIRARMADAPERGIAESDTPTPSDLPVPLGVGVARASAAQGSAPNPAPDAPTARDTGRKRVMDETCRTVTVDVDGQPVHALVRSAGPITAADREVLTAAARELRRRAEAEPDMAERQAAARDRIATRRRALEAHDG